MAAPTVTTQYVSSVTATTGLGNGNVSSDGAQTITDRGVVVSLVANPTTADSKFSVAGTTGVFTASVTGLAGNTTYHLRAYATNAGGTSYGADVIFHTASPLANIAQHTTTLTNISL